VKLIEINVTNNFQFWQHCIYNVGKTGNPNKKPEIQIKKSQIQTKTVFCLDCRPKIVKSRKSKQKPKNVGNSNKKIAYPNKKVANPNKNKIFLSHIFLSKY
jgi:hypothetical protein